MSAQIIPADLSPSSVLIYCLVASILIPEMPGPAYGFAPSPRTLNLASFSVGCTILTSRWVLTASSKAAKPWPSMESVCDANYTVACPSSPSAETKRNLVKIAPSRTGKRERSPNNQNSVIDSSKSGLLLQIKTAAEFSIAALLYPSLPMCLLVTIADNRPERIQ